MNAKLLDGREIADFIKLRHLQQVRRLRGVPRLAILHDSAGPATAVYTHIKQEYGQDIGASVDIREVETQKLKGVITELNDNPETQGLIVQLPLAEPSLTAEVVAAINPAKDVDGLGPEAQFDPATAKGVLWLLASYQVEVQARTVAVVGQGRVVGAPLTAMLEDLGAKVLLCDEQTADLKAQTLQSDIVVMATGQPGLLKADMVKPGAVVVDCGSPASEIDPALFNNPTLSITPNPGGVGPMTVAALFDNLLIAAAATNRNNG